MASTRRRPDRERRGAGARLLVVEDNRTTAHLLRRVLEDVDGVDEIEVVRDGVAAIEALDPETGGPSPDLVLLDLGLPGRNGHEVLAAAREGLGLDSLPIVILSSSGDPEDVRRAYAAGANGYVQKPAGVEGLEVLREAVGGFWLGAAELPRSTSTAPAGSRGRGRLEDAS